MPNAPALGNSFAALAGDYGSSDEDGTPALPRVKMEVNEEVIPPLGLDATTRVEVDLTASEGSPPANDVTLTPPHGGGVRAREDTPSASLAFQERQAKINASNNERRRGEVFGGASGMVASTKQVTSLPFCHPPAPASLILRPLPAGDAEILVPETQLAPGSGPESNQPKVRTPKQAAASVTVIDYPQRTGGPEQRAARRQRPSRRPRRHEGGSYAREVPGSWRTGARTHAHGTGSKFRPPDSANPRVKNTAPTSPSPAPSAARSQAGTGAASPEPQGEPPAPPLGDAGADNIDMYDDVFPIPQAAQPQAPLSPSPDAPAVFVPRGENLVGEHRTPTDKELAAMTAFAPELAQATVLFKAYGAMTPIDGALQDAHLYGVGEKQIAYFDSKPGPKIVCYVHAMFNKLASAFTVDEIIEMLENLSDRLFVAFPDDRIMWSHLFTPGNAPGGRRVRMNMFVGRNVTPRQQIIWNAGRFMNAGDAQLISYFWREPASDYRYSFAHFRSKIVDVALQATRDAMYDSDEIKASITRQAQEDGIDPVDLMIVVCQRIRLGMIMVARPKSTALKPQYDVHLKVDDLFSDDELTRFLSAFRALCIQHEEHGKASIVRWSCRFCLAISHPVGKCAAAELAGWKEQPSAPAPAGPSAPNFNKPRRDGFNQPPAQPFNGGRRGGQNGGHA